MSTQQQDRFSVLSLLLLALVFIFAVIVSNQLFRGVRLDLTENRLYTLSDGTKRILESIDEPINLYFYFSDDATKGIPSLRDYANRVEEMLEEFADASGGKLDLAVIDPLPFSEDEDRAAQFGLQGVQLAVSTDPVYLGLAGTNSVGDEEIIEFFQPDREATLEYDIARLVSTLANPERTVVGLVSGISMGGDFNPQMQRMSSPWVAYQQAQQLFEIRDLGTSFDTVPEDVGVLWIVQPKDLSAATQYAIDQFVMRGGKALILVDPMAGVDTAATPGMPQGMPPVGQGSDLPLLFQGWGIDFTADEVVADARSALQISSPTGGAIRHYAYLGIAADGISADDITTAELSSVNFAMAGSVRLAEESAATLEPLVTSSTSSMLMPASRFAFLPDPRSLQDGFAALGEPLTLAARIGGDLASAFPDGPPASDEEAAEDDETAGAESEEEPSAHLAASAEPVGLVIVTDVDMLSDSMWAQVQNFFGQQLVSAFASNGAFIINALESLAGDANLVSVRSRGSFSRPFTKVEELRVAAEAEYRETEQRLQQELAETESRLGELQASREDSGSLLLTPEQEAEIDRFIDQRAAIRKELRAVQRGLDEDIENLGTLLKVINIGLVPLLLTLGVLLVVWRRRREGRS